MLTLRLSRTSFEIVDGSLQRYLDISLNDIHLSNDFSMYLRSSKVRCLLFPGIKFDIRTSFTATGRAVMRIAKNYAVIKVQCERFNSTYARLNPALGFESRISKYISGATVLISSFVYMS